MNNSIDQLVAIRQASFVAKYEPLWQAFDDLCQNGQANHSQANYNKDRHGQAYRNRRRVSQQLSSPYALISLYRQICEHYALACQRHYSPQLIKQLHDRVMLGHRLIYHNKKSYTGQFVQFVIATFPNAVRANAALFWLCFGLFYVPCLVMGLVCYLNDEFIYNILSPLHVMQMEQMYDPANEHIGRGADRASDTDLMMFGHYVRNNIGIDFQVYAMGIFFGVGTVFVTLYNGVVIGAVSGHLTQVGFGSTFWSFVCGHGSFELTAIVISAMAGLKLATPLIAPAPYSRKHAFVVAGKQSIVLLLGAAMMTFVAAFIEAFWSSAAILNEIKYGVAVALWGFVAWYLLYCGKNADHALNKNNQ